MEHDKHLHSTDSNRPNTEDDQLRDNTMNETIRQAQGSANANISNLSDGSGQLHSSGRNSDANDLYNPDSSQGTALNTSDDSTVSSSDIANTDDETAGRGITGVPLSRSASITTKRGLTGSDFDGQAV